jgi:hypothetical protein
MWLHLVDADATGNELVLTDQDNEITLTHKQRGSKSQQWMWNDNTHYLWNIKTGRFLGADNKNIATSNQSQNSAFTWWYDQKRQALTTKADHWTANNNDEVGIKFLAAKKERLMPGADVFVTMSNRAKANQHYQWRIEYCDQDNAWRN